VSFTVLTNSAPLAEYRPVERRLLVVRLGGVKEIQDHCDEEDGEYSTHFDVQVIKICENKNKLLDNMAHFISNDYLHTAKRHQ
jgi:hypothetical protein